MPGPAVTIVESGGLPVRAVDSNAPVLTEAAGGFPITITDNGAPFIVESGFDPDPSAAAYFEAMSVQPDDDRKQIINTLIVSLKAAGVWGKLDWLSLVASHDAQAGRINAVAPSQVMTVSSAPTFTTDRGYTGDGVDDYLNTGWNPTTAPSPKLVRDSAHYGLWLGTDVAATAQYDFGNSNAMFNSHYDATRIRAGISAASALITPGGTPNAAGHWSVSRTASTGFQIYKNGAAYGAAQSFASTGLTNSNFLALAYNGNSAGGLTPSSYSTRRLQALHWGSGLTSGDVVAIRAALLEYMTAIGAV